MPAHRAKGVVFLVIQVVGNLDPGIVDFHEIERIPFAFSATAVAGSLRAGLHQNDPLVARSLEEEIEGVADERTVQMAAQDDVDAHLDERLHRPSPAEHIPVSQPIRSSDEMVVSH